MPRCRCALSTSANLVRATEKLSFCDPVESNLPTSLSKFRWDVQKIERKIQDKILEKNKISGAFLYQQAYRLFQECGGNDLDFIAFQEQLRIKFGILLQEHELQQLFEAYDIDKNGRVSLSEFIRKVLPTKDTNLLYFETSQEVSEKRQISLRQRARNDYLSQIGQRKSGDESIKIVVSSDGLEEQILNKIMQRTTGNGDQMYKAVRMLRVDAQQTLSLDAFLCQLRLKFGVFTSVEELEKVCLKLDCLSTSGRMVNIRKFVQALEACDRTKKSGVVNGLWTDIQCSCGASRENTNAGLDVRKLGRICEADSPVGKRQVIDEDSERRCRGEILPPVLERSLPSSDRILRKSASSVWNSSSGESAKKRPTSAQVRRDPRYPFQETFPPQIDNDTNTKSLLRNYSQPDMRKGIRSIISAQPSRRGCLLALQDRVKHTQRIRDAMNKIPDRSGFKPIKSHQKRGVLPEANRI